MSPQVILDRMLLVYVTLVLLGECGELCLQAADTHDLSTGGGKDLDITLVTPTTTPSFPSFPSFYNRHPPSATLAVPVVSSRPAYCGIRQGEIQATDQRTRYQASCQGPIYVEGLTGNIQHQTGTIDIVSPSLVMNNPTPCHDLAGCSTGMAGVLSGVLHSW